MARVTVEDCIDKVDSPYELVLVAKERATQLNSGIEPTVSIDDDKNTVIALREIANENIKVSDLTESAIHKLRKHVEQVDDGTADDEEIGDDFQNLYKGEISKSGTPILPSKRARKTPEKIKVSKEDIDELNASREPNIEIAEKQAEESDVKTDTSEANPEDTAVSLDELSDAETDTSEANPEDTVTSNS